MNAKRIAITTCILTFASLRASTLFISSGFGSSTIGSYDSQSGLTLNQSLISINSGPTYGLAYENGTLFVSSSSLNSIGSYNSNTGTTINASLISGLIYPGGLANDNTGNIFVADTDNAMIGKYTTSGAIISRDFAAGLNYPYSITTSGGYIFVGYSNSGVLKVGKLTPAGSIVDLNFISISNGGGYNGMAIDENGALYVGYNGGIGKWDSSSGLPINTNLIGVTPTAMIADSGSLLVAIGDKIQKYDSQTGAIQDSAFITAPTTITAITLSSVPESNQSIAIGAVFALGVISKIRRIRRRKLG